MKNENLIDYDRKTWKERGGIKELFIIEDVWKGP